MIGDEHNLTIDDLVIEREMLYKLIRKSLTRDPFEHYVNGILGLSICFLGMLTNAFSFSILIRRTMRLSTYVYLAGLCLSDSIACLSLIPTYILDAYPIEVPDSELPRTYTYMQLTIIAGAIGTSARALSIWLCVAFTIDRWIMICRPFVGPRYCTLKHARWITVMIYILGILYAIPLLFEFETREAVLNEILLLNNSKKLYRFALSKFGSNLIFRWSYVFINALGVYIIPLAIIVVLNRKLLITIRLLEHRSTEYNKSPLHMKQGVTTMLLSTTIMLFVFRLPSIIVSIMWLVNAKRFITEKSPFLLRKFHSIANLCSIVNAATTFILFIVYGTKFRSELTRIYFVILNKIIRKRSHILSGHEQQMKLLIPNIHDVNEQNLYNQFKMIELNRSSVNTIRISSITSLESVKPFNNQQNSEN